MIAAARDGNHDAFEELVRRHQQALFRFLLARVGQRDDAEDLAQDAFVNAFRYLHTYRKQSAFRTWLFTIAYRLAGRGISRQARRRELAANAGHPETLMPGASHSRDPEWNWLREDQQMQLWRDARQHLSEQQFTALWLRYYEDLSIDEVSGVLQRPATWVKVNLHRARAKLGRILRERGAEHMMVSL